MRPAVPVLDPAADAPAAPVPFSPRVAILIVLTLFPYLALPVGDSTNLPLASLFAVAFAREIMGRPRLLVPFLVLSLGPILMLYVQFLLGRSLGWVIHAGVWFFQVLPFVAVAAAVVVSAHTVRITLRVVLIAAAGYAVVQKFFLDSGVLPFVWMYDLPGYWSVPDNLDEIVTYVRRPFGWFPEPSFMAGTLVLASIGLLLLGYRERNRPSVPDLLAVGLVAVAMALSQSGSALPTLPVLAALAILPCSSVRRQVAFVLAGIVLWAVVATDLLESRYSTPNASWNDRLASIIGGGRYLLDNQPFLFTGIGVGGSTALYEHRLIPLSGLGVAYPLDDIFSVSGGIVMSNGIIAGAAMLAVLLVPIVWAFAHSTSPIFGVLAAAAWFVVASLTISYDSAAWIWALPGLCLGVLLSNRERRST